MQQCRRAYIDKSIRSGETLSSGPLSAWVLLPDVKAWEPQQLRAVLSARQTSSGCSVVRKERSLCILTPASHLVWRPPFSCMQTIIIIIIIIMFPSLPPCLALQPCVGLGLFYSFITAHISDVGTLAPRPTPNLEAQRLVCPLPSDLFSWPVFRCGVVNPTPNTKS
jgi:hypothetical protein